MGAMNKVMDDLMLRPPNLRPFLDASYQGLGAHLDVHPTTPRNLSMADDALDVGSRERVDNLRECRRVAPVTVRVDRLQREHQSLRAVCVRTGALHADVRDDTQGYRVQRILVQGPQGGKVR